MSGINKLSFTGWILGIALGVAASGSALAGNVADTFTTGNALTAAQMTNIKNAVNDNDTKLNAIQAGTQTCAAGMTRVGPTCVDNARQAASQSWTAAVDFCRAANKRLLTPGEYLAAFNATLITAANGEFEWVDQVSHDGTVGVTAGKLSAGYMGPSTTLTGQILFSTNVLYDDATNANIFFRCAR